MLNKENAKQYILKNARPLELSLYKFFYEKGDKASVLQELHKYQNPDGGFGHGIEADNWNPNSNPIATNDALIILYRIDSLDSSSKIVKDIVRYLSSHDSFDEDKRRWLFAIESNENYPHAIWWKKDGDGISHFNPTVSLAAFMICYGDSKDKEFYAQIVRDAFEAIVDLKEFGDELKCYMLAHALLTRDNINDVINLNDTKNAIENKLKEIICDDTSKYGVEYVPTPSDFFIGIYNEFLIEDIKPLIVAEKDILEHLQKKRWRI